MKKILIVEDQADLRRLLDIVLNAEGCQLWETARGEEAIEIAREILPDLILLDVMLPGKVDGYEVARILKNDPATIACVIIIMTAKVQEQDRLEAFNAGADDFIGKPFHLDELMTKVENYLR